MLDVGGGPRARHLCATVVAVPSRGAGVPVPALPLSCWAPRTSHSSPCASISLSVNWGNECPLVGLLRQLNELIGSSAWHRGAAQKPITTVLFTSLCLVPLTAVLQNGLLSSFYKRGNRRTGGSPVPRLSWKQRAGANSLTLPGNLADSSPMHPFCSQAD